MSENKDIDSPNDFESAVVISEEAGEGILSRLDWMVLQPAVIVEVNCRTGITSAKLKTRYPLAQVFSLDQSQAMLNYAKNKEINAICADAMKLPFADASVDLVIVNLLFAWHPEPELLLREWQRVLRHDGVLILSAFGPDTLREINPNIVVPNRLDMHLIGDMLLKAGFKEPVADVDYCTLTYRDTKKMQHELQIMALIADDIALLPEMSLQATFELVYAHAFVDKTIDQGFRANEKGEVRVPLSALIRKNKS